jgi:pSer/pThr/pTyr-binding forkhead associated (FHA) protein
MASIASPARARLRLLEQGGESGCTYPIRNEVSIGRTEGSITFPRDSFMSSSHARIVKRGADFLLIDEESSNGTFMKVKKETKLEPGDVILVGQQLFRFEA